MFLSRLNMRIKVVLKVFSTLLLISAASFANAGEYTITFDEAGLHTQTVTENYGTVLDDEYAASGIDTVAGVDVTFWAQSSWTEGDDVSSSNADLFLTLFNSDLATGETEDDDLLVDQGNIAIIHERNGECSVVSNQCTDPDDKHEDPINGVHGGFIFIEFSEPVSVHSIGFADIESGTNQLGQFAFIDSAGAFLGYQQMDVTGNGGYTEQDTYLGETMTEASAGDLISYIVIKMVGSGGINDITFSKAATSVPEPTNIVILMFGLLMMSRLRKS